MRRWQVCQILTKYECRFACDGRAKYTVYNAFCPGVATIGDSLMVLDKLVFKEKDLNTGNLLRYLKIILRVMKN